MKLRIAQITDLYESVPPPLYGGTQRIVSSLTEGLVKKGHSVTLFACGNSKTKGELVSVYPHAMYRDHIEVTNIMYPILNITELFKRTEEFDIIHAHLSIVTDYISLLGSLFFPKKFIYTIHFTSPSLKGYKDRMAVLNEYKNANYVSISNSARQGYEHLKWIDTVYNGIEMDQFTFQPHPQDYFAWLGKFNPDKGTKEAILAAKKAGVKLILAGTIDLQKPRFKEYYEKEVKPLTDGKQIIYIGEKGGKEKDEFLGNAKGFLNPIIWEEPFGLVSVEAMATGTPVISFKRGALKETVKDGKTGYLVETLNQMVEKIKTIEAIDRKTCRKWVEDNFSAKRMVEKYEKLYQKLVVKGNVRK